MRAHGSTDGDYHSRRRQAQHWKTAAPIRKNPTCAHQTKSQRTGQSRPTPRRIREGRLMPQALIRRTRMAHCLAKMALEEREHSDSKGHAGASAATR